jgi:nucleoside-triphosphatase THEP1
MAASRRTPTESIPGDIHLLCGPPRSGKTTALQEIVAAARAANLDLAGFTARGSFRDGVRSGFDLQFLDGSGSMPLCRATAAPRGPARVDLDAAGGPRVGHFCFETAALAAGDHALTRAVHADRVIVDEVGWLELAGGGWDRGVKQLVARGRGTILLVVRDELVLPVRARYAIEHAIEHRADGITELLARFGTTGAPHEP